MLFFSRSNNISDSVFTDVFNLKKFKEEIESWIDSSGLDQNSFAILIDDYRGSSSVILSICYLRRIGAVEFLIKRNMDFFKVLNNFETFEIEMFKINVTDCVRHFSSFGEQYFEKIIADNHRVSPKRFYLRYGERLEPVSESEIDLNNVDSIYSLIDDSSETPEDAISRIKNKLLNALK